jgi:hypothetical protein
MPRNRSHQVANKMLIKTDLARSFEKDLTDRLKGAEKALKEFAGEIDLKTQYIKAEFYIFTPSDKLLTKQRAISQMATDFDAHKLFVDVVFKCLGLNDKLIRDGRIITPASDDGNWNYIVLFEMRPINELEFPWTKFKLDMPSSILNSEESQSLL